MDRTTSGHPGEERGDRRVGAFLRGILLGGAIVAAGAVALSLMAPPPDAPFGADDGALGPGEAPFLAGGAPGDTTGATKPAAETPFRADEQSDTAEPPAMTDEPATAPAEPTTGAVEVPVQRNEPASVPADPSIEAVEAPVETDEAATAPAEPTTTGAVGVPVKEMPVQIDEPASAPAEPSQEAPVETNEPAGVSTGASASAQSADDGAAAGDGGTTAEANGIGAPAAGTPAGAGQSAPAPGDAPAGGPDALLGSEPEGRRFGGGARGSGATGPVGTDAGDGDTAAGARRPASVGDDPVPEVAAGQPAAGPASAAGPADDAGDPAVMERATEPGATATSSPDADQRDTGETSDSIALAPPDEEGERGAGDGADQAEPGRGALEINARPFEASRREPLLAVVLVEGGHGFLDDQSLAMLPMPVTVAIRPDAPGSGRLGASARSAGHEVLADLASAEGAEGTALVENAADAAAELDMALGATAVGAAADAEALTPVLRELAGRGMAWVDTGAKLGGPAQEIAGRVGMAYAVGNRIAAGDSSAEQIYGAIDSAAHQAQQWGTAVVFLGASEAALQALIDWGLANGGDRVLFAPISAVIARRGGG